MNPRIAGMLLLLALISCDDEPNAPAAKAEAPALVEAKGSGDANAADAKADAPVKADAITAHAPADVVPTREWLVWVREGDRWTTRWVGEVDGATTTIAERKALVHSTGDKLFELARKDVVVDIRTCGCNSSDFGPKGECARTGSVVRPGLVATELGVGDEIVLVAAEADARFGEIYGLSLQITGGVDGWLVVHIEDAGYYCGAHQSIFGGDQMFDLGATDPTKPVPWPEVDLPTDVETAAATGEMFELYKGCEVGDETLDVFVRDTMRWSGLAVALDAGAPKITWEFSADVHYACSPSYLTIGTTTTDLLKEAAPLGLARPLPDGLSRALKAVGTGDAVGWAELKLPAGRRGKMLERFNAVDETPWPPAESTAALDPRSRPG